MEGDLCLICSERLFTLSPGLPAAGEERICGLCRRARPAYQRAVAFGEYNGELRELLHLLKYEGMQPAAGFLSGLLAQAIARLAVTGLAMRPPSLSSSSSIVAPANMIELGDNFIAIGEHLEIAEIGYAIARTPKVTGIGLADLKIAEQRHQRRANVRGAFRVTRPAVANQTIVVIDDVFTTGITASECARVLMRAGANQVFVATVARVLKGEVARPIQSIAAASA